MGGRAGQLCGFPIGRALPSILLLLLFASVSPLWAAGLSGTYEGIGAGAGMALVLNETGDRVEGTFRPRDNLEYRLAGERSAKGAEGSLVIGGKASTAFFHLEERKLGVQFLFIPANKKGLPDIASAREYSFLREGARKEAASEFSPAPQTQVDTVHFIDHYTEWSPSDVARQYSGLPEDMRALIQLYDYASVDVIWRICRSSPPNDEFPRAALDKLLDRQTADCGAILQLAKNVKQRGQFDEFLRRAKFEMQLVRSTVQCSRGLMPQARCAEVSAIGAPLILRWQDATVLLGGKKKIATAPGTPPPAQTPADMPPDMAADTSVANGRTGEMASEQKGLPLPRPDVQGVADGSARAEGVETPGAVVRTNASAPLPLMRPRR